jgi:hypothetical protein
MGRKFETGDRGGSPMNAGILTGLAVIEDKYGAFRQINICFIILV